MKNKEKVRNCPNFYKICEFEFTEDDYISATLIDLYKEYVFEESNIENIKKLDYILGKYIDDYLFRKEVQRSVKDAEGKIVDNVFKAYDNYEFGYTRNIYFARWI